MAERKDRIGQQLGNYRLIRLLGHGGFADVYLGEHIYLHTQAAIKVLHTEIEQEDVDKFRNEASTIAHLSHPHIIRVFDFEVENATPFLVMDYASNGSLRQLYPKGARLAPATFLPYVKQVASALQYAHDRKLIHRDVKPGNMLLGSEDQVLLSDFGIALIAQNTHSQSTEDVIIGTMSYMAPEQIQGKPRPASDQYAFGVVVYEWLTGIKPFNGSYVEIVSQHLSAPPPPLREQIANIPPAVEQVVLKALNKDPHQRFPRVQDFADALERGFQANAPLVLRSPATTAPVSTIPSGVSQRNFSSGMVPQVQSLSAPAISPYTGTASSPSQSSPVTTDRSWPRKPSSSDIKRPIKRGLRVLGFGIGTLIAVLLLCSLLVFGGGYFVFTHFIQPPAAIDTTGATALSSKFVQELSSRTYAQAYHDLSPSLVQQESQSQFQQQAQSEDSCYGTVTSYVNKSTIVQGKTVQAAYTIKRQKIPAYTLTLTLQQDGNGKWGVTDFNSTAGDGQNLSCG